jgi:hypothetical protein
VYEDDGNSSGDGDGDGDSGVREATSDALLTQFIQAGLRNKLQALFESNFRE